MSAETLSALLIEVAGVVTSFRYPFFTQGFQPTFEMPPPSTIYGFLCSTVGDFLPPEQVERLRFGYRFVHAGKFVDHREHLHFSDPVQPFPFDRQLLFRPRLTLYLVDQDTAALEQLAAAFQQPYYTLVLGRSQDLMTRTRLERINLQRAERGYFDHTLLPLTFAPLLDADMISATMPRYVDPSRRVETSQYALLRDLAVYPPPVEIDEEADIEAPLIFESAGDIPLWSDPTSPDHPRERGLKRLVYLHSFRE